MSECEAIFLDFLLLTAVPTARQFILADFVIMIMIETVPFTLPVPFLAVATSIA